MKVPFSVYDFFGYLASGYLVLASVDIAFSKGWVLVDSMPVPRALAEQASSRQGPSPSRTRCRPKRGPSSQTPSSRRSRRR